MKFLLALLIASCIGSACAAQQCAAPKVAGYTRDTTVTVDEARRVILTSFAAINGCNLKVKLRSGDFYYYTADGSIVMVENFTSILDDETKLRLIAKLKPGITLKLDNMHYGDDNQLAPPISITLIKGRS